MRASSLPPGPSHRETSRRVEGPAERPPLADHGPPRLPVRRSRLPRGGAGHPLSDAGSDPPSSKALAEELPCSHGDGRLEDLGWRAVKGPLHKSASGPLPLGAEGGEDLVIHVIDEVRSIRRDFTCKRGMLLNHMKYFESYLAGLTNEDEVDISVHCDIDVFEWLAEYMEDERKIEALDASTVVSILISSNFLQMAKLVGECLVYISRYINQVVRLPIDLGCLSDDLVRRLAALFTDDELHSVRDKRDRIVDRLFAHKVEELLDDEENALFMCACCRGLFTARQREVLVCPKAPIFIDFHGNVIARHVASKSWDAGRHVQHCHDHLKFSWQQIYWRLWTQMQLLYCSRCHSHFCGAEYEHCSYHPEKPVWQGPRGHVGTYPCCQQPAFKFAAPSVGLGCCAREHAVDLKRLQNDPGLASQATVLEKLLRHRAETCVPFADRLTDRFLGDAQPSNCPGVLSDDEEDEGLFSEDEQRDACNDAGDDDRTQRWDRSSGHRGRAWYCMDPPPEHCHPDEHPAFKQPRGGRRRRVKQSRRNSGASKEADGGKMADADTNGSMSLMQRGCWPTPPAEGVPSFFNFHLPTSMSAQRKLEYRMDMLREDDRRRMDMITARIHHHNEAQRPPDPHQKAPGAGPLAHQPASSAAQRRHRGRR